MNGRGGRGSLLFTNDRFQHISRLRNVRQVNLGLDPLRLRSTAASGFPATLTFTRSAKMRTDFLGLVVFQRTGMRLLLCDAQFRQDIENRFTLDLEISG